MKAHLSNATHSYQYISNRQDWDIDAWCRKLKITRKKLENHPRIEDVGLLLAFDEHSTWFTQKDTEIWTHCWQWAYKYEHELSKYQKNKLLSIITGIEFRQQRLNQIKARQQKKQQKLAAV
jgi:hypothetical protein